MKILVINGPNLQLLGRREPEIYGKLTLDDLEDQLKQVAAAFPVELDFFQSNHEGAIVDCIGNAPQNGFSGIIINPAAYTHTSVAILDALKGAGLPAVEVHLSNVKSRESFRQHSYTAAACVGVIAGLGFDGYEWALRSLVRILNKGSL